VDASISYLRRHPKKSLSIARAAAAAGAAPMSLYRHFRSGADLAEAIVTKVLEGIEDGIPQNADWRAQVQAWMDAIYRRFLDIPQSVELLTNDNSLSLGWIRVAAGLRKSLMVAGLSGAKLSDAVFWILLSVVRFAQHAVATPMETQIGTTMAAISRLEAAEKADLAPLVDDVSRLYTHAVEIMFERMLDSVEVLIAKRD
jgi:AcrR family transcriptional regulator